MSQQKQITSRISLWNVDSENEKAPVARGTIQLTAEVVEELYQLIEDGEELVTLGVAIWETDSDNEKAPTFSGKVKSPSEREAEMEAAAEKKNSGKSSKRTSRKRS